MIGGGLAKLIGSGQLSVSQYWVSLPRFLWIKSSRASALIWWAPTQRPHYNTTWCSLHHLWHYSTALTHFLCSTDLGYQQLFCPLQCCSNVFSLLYVLLLTEAIDVYSSTDLLFTTALADASPCTNSCWSAVTYGSFCTNLRYSAVTYASFFTNSCCSAVTYASSCTNSCCSGVTYASSCTNSCSLLQ